MLVASAVWDCRLVGIGGHLVVLLGRVLAGTLRGGCASFFTSRFCGRDLDAQWRRERERACGLGARQLAFEHALRRALCFEVGPSRAGKSCWSLYRMGRASFLRRRPAFMSATRAAAAALSVSVGGVAGCGAGEKCLSGGAASVGAPRKGDDRPSLSGRTGADAEVGAGRREGTTQ